MKKFIVFLGLLAFSMNCALAENYSLKSTITFNWDNITQEERDQDISYLRKNIFEESSSKRKIENFKITYKDFLKDKNYKKHYIVAAAGYKEYNDYNIAAMYIKRLDTPLIYALQQKNNLTTIYYYDAMGNLRYLDKIKGAYPNFPYYTEQYRRSGKLAGISYFISNDTQYIFKPNGEFKGVWHKENFYNEKGKIIAKRSNY